VAVRIRDGWIHGELPGPVGERTKSSGRHATISPSSASDGTFEADRRLAHRRRPPAGRCVRLLPANGRLWPEVPGCVRAYIELPGDDYWDPGRFDYPEFFSMVRDVFGGDEDMRMDELIKGHQAYRDKFKSRGEDPGPPPQNRSDDFKEGWAAGPFRSEQPGALSARG